jgi:hypothetical protein
VGFEEEVSAMQGSGGRIVGLLTMALGVVVVLVAVLLFGLTKTSNGESTVDWVSLLTAVGGLAIFTRGLSTVVRHG